MLYVRRMAFEFVRYEKRDHVAFLTMHRPEVMNALHPPAHEELDRCWDDFAADDDCWVAVLTGAGERAFSAGNDLKWTAQHGVPRMPKSGFAGITSRFDLWTRCNACFLWTPRCSKIKRRRSVHEQRGRRSVP